MHAARPLADTIVRHTIRSCACGLVHPILLLPQSGQPIRGQSSRRNVGAGWHWLPLGGPKRDHSVDHASRIGVPFRSNKRNISSTQAVQMVRLLGQCSFSIPWLSTRRLSYRYLRFERPRNLLASRSRGSMRRLQVPPVGVVPIGLGFVAALIGWRRSSFTTKLTISRSKGSREGGEH
jgi:hypothetical protein